MRNEAPRTPKDVLEILRQTLETLQFRPDPDIDLCTRTIFRLALARRITMLEAESARTQRPA